MSKITVTLMVTSGLVVVGYNGVSAGVNAMKTSAIKHGHAEYRINPTNYAREFHWLPACKEAK